MSQNRTTKTCLTCGVAHPLEHFKQRTKPDGSPNGLARVCNMCLAQRSTEPSPEREAYFWSLMDRSGECWLWTGGQDGADYGVFRWGNRPRRAHRLAWILTNGPIPKGLFVCHRCDTPRCCNPAHLFLGSSADNNRDRHAKGRSSIPVGERHGMAILTEREVRAIRDMYAAGGWTYRSLGQHFGVSESTIMFVVRRWHWKHVA